jgi:hypothetical protein
VLALIAFTMTSPVAAAGELQVIRTYNVRDIVLAVLNETGEWTTGRWPDRRRSNYLQPRG